KEDYILYLSRIEPENNAAMVVEAFLKVDTVKQLVIVGDAPYADKYKEYLKALVENETRIRFLGAIYGPDKKALEQNAAVYVHATEVGGTHPALIEAMGAGNCCLVYETPENREVAGEAGLYYQDDETLAGLLRRVMSDDQLVNDYRRRAQERVRKHYDWETVTDEYEQLFSELARQ
ncbi:MAG TPA: glycosyltransferase, partial [Pyrinomonadaceae bacterium]